jgi:1-deoxy-D-xylulose-5-phosphate reductoisomerase
VKKLAILGSTGSIGTSTLDLVEALPGRFAAVALAGGHNVALLREQIRKHQPRVVAVAERDSALALRQDFPDITIAWGEEGLVEVASHEDADMVVAALVGSIGLLPTLAAIRRGKDIALANKETLVVAGSLVMDEAEQAGVHVVPVDSEHNAIHQALRVGPPGTVRRLILTASGGPFRQWSRERIRSATIADALAHPTWKMGPKITVDSASMMNKGLEIIEAHHLFAMPGDRIDVVVHPQSIVHSLVEYVDGTMIAQMAINDMRFPILYALAWPERMTSPLGGLDLTQVAELSFEAPDPQRFPALDLARSALEEGGEMPAALNAANEVAVAAFLDGRATFDAIPTTIARILEAWQPRNRPLTSVDQALAADREARQMASMLLSMGDG